MVSDQHAVTATKGKETMSFLTMIAKAKAGSNSDGDYFIPDVTGTMIIERVFQHTGELGTSVILKGTVEECSPKYEGGKCHTAGSVVKKVYSLTKYPTVHPGMLKGDLLAIDGLKEDDLSAKDMEAMLSEIFENPKSPMFELRGVRVKFDTKSQDRSKKGKEPITKTVFINVPNDPNEVAARKKEIDARLAKAA